MREKLSTIERTRRDFLQGRALTTEMHIASLLVQARPERLAAVEAVLLDLPGVESHGSNGAGKLIVTVETYSDAELVDTINRIETSKDVIVASLVYHQTEEMTDEA